MKEVKLIINGKEYRKTQPSVKDWVAMMNYTEAANGKNVAKDPEAFNATLIYVADFLDIPVADLEDHDQISDIFDAMRTIDANLTEAFRGATDEKNADGGQAPPK